MTMVTSKRSAIPRNLPRSLATYTHWHVSDRAGRLIQIALALYLLPVLLIVLAMGVFGIIMLAASRLIFQSVRRSVA